MSIKFIHSVEIIFHKKKKNPYLQYVGLDTSLKSVWSLCLSSILCRPPPPVKLNVLQLTIFLQVQYCPSPKNPAAHEQL